MTLKGLSRRPDGIADSFRRYREWRAVFAPNRATYTLRTSRPAGSRQRFSFADFEKAMELYNIFVKCSKIAEECAFILGYRRMNPVSENLWRGVRALDVNVYLKIFVIKFW